jgi:hypothetical protein
LSAAYQAKSENLCSYTPTRIARRDGWLGSLLNDDFAKLRDYRERFPLECLGGMFNIFNVSDSTKQVKYSDTRHVAVEEAMRVTIGQITEGQHVLTSTIDCGEADGTRVKIHMLVFEDRTR